MPSRRTWDETWMAVAHAVAQRSSCDRDKVGAVIVSSTNRIIDTGYNGPPAGYAPIHSDGCVTWCPRAAAADWFQHGQGDVPAIVSDAAFTGPQSDYSDCPSLHAEANALMFSDRRLRENGTIYVTSHICSACAKLVANSGLARVVVDGAKPAIHRRPLESIAFLKECGLEVDVL